MQAPTSCPDAHRRPSSQSPTLPSSSCKKRRVRAESVDEPSPKTIEPSASCGDDSDEPEKKRNKLGYQRSTIACVHCRRRKIRCMISAKEPGGKCTHCTRMKKDCSFVPVDQSSVRAKKKREIIQKAATASPESMNQPFANGLNDYYPMAGSLSMEPSPNLPPSAWIDDAMLGHHMHPASMEPFPTFESIPPLSYPELIPHSSNWNGSHLGAMQATSAPFDETLHPGNAELPWPLSPPTHLDPQHFTTTQFPQRPSSSSFASSAYSHVKHHFQRGHPSRSFSTSDLDMLEPEPGLHRAQTISMPIHNFSMDGADQYISPTSSEELSKGYFKSPLPVAGEMMTSGYYDSPMLPTPLSGRDSFLSPFPSLPSASPQPPSLSLSPQHTSRYGSMDDQSSSLASVSQSITPQSMLDARYGSVEPQCLTSSGSMDPQYATIDPSHPMLSPGETLNAAKLMLQQQQLGADQWFTDGM